jgi:hypothetical protein
LFIITAIELLAKRVWFRSLAKIRRMRSAGASPDTPATPSSPATRLPQEIVEIIIAYLIYDTCSLRACILICHSWYTASVPHLHHTLIIQPCWWAYESKNEWPKPLQNASELGLLPLVKTLRLLGIHDRIPWFSSKQFNRRILRHFLALTNVQELVIDNLDIPSFMPMVQRYFGHFSPTVRTLALKDPIGSSRQILYFIGLFEHLENLTLIDWTFDPRESEPADDLTPVPLFTPPLRGWLVIDTPARVGFLEGMNRVFGGI